MIPRKRPPTTLQQLAMRQIAGLKSKRAGDGFEKLFESACNRQRIIFDKVPTGCEPVRPIPGGRIGRQLWAVYLVRTPFDFLMEREGSVAFIDCKTIEDGYLTYSMINSDSSRHQVLSLARFSRAIAAGFVVYFRRQNIVAFFNAEQLLRVKPRESLKPEDGLLLGRDTDFSPELIFNCGAMSAPKVDIMDPINSENERAKP